MKANYICNLSNSSVQNDISEFGWKAGILEFLKRDPELTPHILPGFYISPEKINSWEVPNLSKDFEKYYEGWLLYRSTNPADIFAYIGILPTFSNNIQWIITQDINFKQKQEQFNLIKKIFTLSIIINSVKKNLKISTSGTWLPNFVNPILVINIVKKIKSWKLSIEEVEKILEEYKKIEYSNKILETRSILNTDNPHYYTINKIREKIADIVRFDLPEYLKRYELPNPIDTTGIYVQPKITWSYVWSVVEHPNRPWIFIVSYRWADWDIHNRSLYTDFIWEDWSYKGSYLDSNYTENDKVWPYTLKAVEIYQKCREKKIFDETISFQMEFWAEEKSNKIYIYQLRQFRPFETSSWKLDNWNKWLSFGITWPEWIKISLNVQNAVNLIFTNKELLSIPYNSGLLALNLNSEIHPSIPIENLDLFWSWGISRPNLEHSLYYPSYVSKIALLDSCLLTKELQYDSYTNNDVWFYNVFSDWIKTKMEKE